MVEHKIATCCYCGARAALTLSGDTRHELACASCGAPLRKLKPLRVAAVADQPKPSRPKVGPTAQPSRKGSKPERTEERRSDRPRPQPTRAPRRKKREKKRRGLLHRFLKEAIDEIEDLFD